MIPPSAIIVKFVSQNVDGLIRALKVYDKTDRLVYSLAILSHTSGNMITNRSLDSGPAVADFLSQYEKNGTLQNTTIIVSRELLASNDIRSYVKQPFSPRLSLTTTIRQLPVLFIAGEAKRDQGSVSSQIRDYLFSSCIQVANKSKSVTNKQYFTSLTASTPATAAIEDCCVIGLFPKTKQSFCEILLKNQKVLILDNEFNIYFAPNGYGNLASTINLNMSKHKDENNEIQIVNEKNDLSEIVKKVIPAPCNTGQLIQFNYLSGNALNCFSHLYVSTFVNDILKVVWLRKAFSSIGGESISKTFADLTDEDIWVFNIKYK